jgi:hypothetical protein
VFVYSVVLTILLSILTAILLYSCGKFVEGRLQVEAPEKTEIEADKDVSELSSVIDFTDLEGGTTEQIV